MKRLLAGLLVLLALVGAARAEPGRENIGFVVGDSNSFGVDLCRQVLLDKKDGNVVLSPYAIASGLAMTSAGMGDRSEARRILERKARLHDQDTLRSAFLAYNRTLDREAGRARPADADRVAMNLTVSLRGAGLPAPPIAFRDSFIREAAYYGVNRVESPKNKNYIRGVVGDAGDEDPLPPAVAAAPAGPYPVALTCASILKGRLTSRGSYGYAETDDLRILEIPYADRTLRLVILLPKKSLAEVEQKLNIGMLPSTLNRVNPHDVELTLPRGEVNTDGLNLREAMVKVGVNFQSAQPGVPALKLADLSSNDADYFLSDVFNRCKVTIGEDDRKAPAKAPPADAPKDKAIVFKVDGPFLFVVRDADYGTILYMGRVVKPEAAKE